MRDQNQVSAPKELAFEIKMGRMDVGDRSEKERQEIKIKFQIVRIARKETKWMKDREVSRSREDERLCLSKVTTEASLRR